MTGKQKILLWRVVCGAVLYAGALLARSRVHNGAVLLLLFSIPFLIAGYDIIFKALRNIGKGQIFDENFLMTIATAAAFCIGEYAEAAAVMLFYQTGELFQSYAVGRSRRSIAAMLDIVPEYANIEENGVLVRVEPDDVEVGTEIIIKAGERIPLDGVVIQGESFIDTAALTGESVPRRVEAGSEVISGCVNGTGALRVRTVKAFEDSTVTRILELVENSAEKKARTENFITRFARVYTPAVTVLALLLAVVPPLFTGDWGGYIKRACIFLVISCPCALVISVPLGFFGGIGAASRSGVLIKGGNFLEALSLVKTVVFDKTGTLTKGEFTVRKIIPNGISEQELLEVAALGEAYSSHPAAMAVRRAFGRELLLDRVSDAEEITGSGVKATVDGRRVILGNEGLMSANGIEFTKEDTAGMVIYAAADGVYLGALIISDTVKDGAKSALSEIRKSGIQRCVMLSGDREDAAFAVADELGIDEAHAKLLPSDKVTFLEALLANSGKNEKLAFVGDGINDAPVLSRADVGIAMGSMGSDAAIEAADVVIMDDDLGKIAKTVRTARKTVGIVKQNIALALSIKAAVLALGALGLADMWLAVVADVGVSVTAILNSMRTLKIP